MPRHRRSPFGLGIFLLAHKLLQTGLNHLPPITLICILLQVAIYMGFVNPPWDQNNICLSGESILYYKDYKRLFLSAIEHLDDIHLYHNMASLIMKGRFLENRFGSMKFITILLTFIASTSLMYVGLAKAAAHYFDEYNYMTQCAVGFSGVLFALKVLTTYYSGSSEQYIHGFFVPSKYAVWIELLIIHLLVPRSSFIGHLAGILVGILYVQGPLRIIVDTICSLIDSLIFPSNGQPSYTYDHGNSSGAGGQRYGWNYDSNSDVSSSSGPESNFLSPEELRQRRMNRFS